MSSEIPKKVLIEILPAKDKSNSFNVKITENYKRVESTYWLRTPFTTKTRSSVPINYKTEKRAYNAALNALKN